MATSVHYLSIAKTSQENFRSKLKNRENCESLAQRIFPFAWGKGYICHDTLTKSCIAFIQTKWQRFKRFTVV